MMRALKDAEFNHGQTDPGLEMHESVHLYADVMRDNGYHMVRTGEKLCAVGMDKLGEPLINRGTHLIETANHLRAAYSRDLSQQLQHNEQIAHGLFALALAAGHKDEPGSPQ